MNTYVIYFSVAGDNLIKRGVFDSSTGRLELLESYETPWGPEAMAADLERRRLFVSCNPRTKPGGEPRPAYNYSFRIEADGRLTQTGRMELPAAPTYIALDKTGKYLLSAHYRLGGASVQLVLEDGTLGPVSQWLWSGGGAHCIQTDRSNRFAFLPHITTSKVNIGHWKPQLSPQHCLPSASNTILQFRFDERTGELIANEPFKIAGLRGGGPRHYVFHPGLDMVYFSCEQGCGVAAYEMDENGRLTPRQFISSLPDEGFDGYSSCSALRISPDGRALYVLNRGHNSIACYYVDETGRLYRTGNVPSEPDCHMIEVMPDGKYVLAGGFRSGKLRIYRADGKGALEQTGVCDIGLNPKWTIIL